jgi:hypothetical protein
MTAQIQTTDDLWSALEQTGAAGRYSKLLHLITIEGLEPFFEVAPRVMHKPEIIAPLVLDRNWRVTLIGTALAVLVRSERLLTPMVEALVQGSWVGPQLAAGIASLPGDADLSPLRRVLENCSPASDPKTVMSAYAALALKHDAAASSFESTGRFSTFWKLDDVRCYQLAARWRGVWSVAGPYFHRQIGTADEAP